MGGFGHDSDLVAELFHLRYWTFVQWRRFRWSVFETPSNPCSNRGNEAQISDFPRRHPKELGGLLTRLNFHDSNFWPANWRYSPIVVGKGSLGRPTTPSPSPPG